MVERPRRGAESFRPPLVSWALSGGQALLAWKLHELGRAGVDMATVGAMVAGAMSVGTGLKALNDQVKLREFRRRRKRFKESAKSHGKARFASVQEIEKAGLLSTNGLLLGDIRIGRRRYRDVRYDQECSGHIVGPPGCLKSTATFISSLLSSFFDESVIVNDPSGEIYKITHQFRRTVSDVVVICAWPDELAKLIGEQVTNAGINFYGTFDPVQYPLSILDDLSFRSQLAIPRARGYQDEKSEFFNRGGRRLIDTLGLYEVSRGRKPSYVSIRSLLMSGAGELESILERASESSAFGGLLAELAGGLSGTMSAGREQWAGYFGVAEKALALYASSTAVGKHVSGAGFDTSRLKGDRPVTVYVITPSERTETHQQLTNATWRYLSQAIISDPRRRRVTALIDECGTSLGYVDGLLNLINIGRKFHFRLVCGWQEICGQAEAIYGREAVRQLLAAGDFLWFSQVRDPESCEMLSKLCGTRAIEDINVNSRPVDGSVMPDQSQGASFKSNAFLRADEIRTFPSDLAIVLYRNLYPICVRKAPYFARPEWNALAGEHPFF